MGLPLCLDRANWSPILNAVSFEGLLITEPLKSGAGLPIIVSPQETRESGSISAIMSCLNFITINLPELRLTCKSRSCFESLSTNGERDAPPINLLRRCLKY